MNHRDPYLYPGTTVLRNKLAISGEAALEVAERAFVTQRMAEGVPSGDFDLAHLKAIHRHLFQDIYDWAGEVRTVDIAKGGSAFMPCRYITNGMHDVHRRIREKSYLVGLPRADFAAIAGTILGDVNHIHPFREGNGRTQLRYLQQLATHAGHGLDLARIAPDRWIQASIMANRGEYDAMARSIADAIVEA